MTSKTVHAWELDDASVEFVTEAVNLLANFQRPEEDEAGIKHYRRAVVDGSMFTVQDVQGTIAYLCILANRAEARAGTLERQAGDRDTAEPQAFRMAADELTRNAVNARQVARDFHRIFNGALDTASHQ